jgi:hypothetical protein
VWVAGLGAVRGLDCPQGWAGDVGSWPGGRSSAWTAHRLTDGMSGQPGGQSLDLDRPPGSEAAGLQRRICGCSTPGRAPERAGTRTGKGRDAHRKGPGRAGKGRDAHRKGSG